MLGELRDRVRRDNRACAVGGEQNCVVTCGIGHCPVGRRAHQTTARKRQRNAPHRHGVNRYHRVLLCRAEHRRTADLSTPCDAQARYCASFLGHVLEVPGGEKHARSLRHHDLVHLGDEVGWEPALRGALDDHGAHGVRVDSLRDEVVAARAVLHCREALRDAPLVELELRDITPARVPDGTARPEVPQEVERETLHRLHNPLHHDLVPLAFPRRDCEDQGVHPRRTLGVRAALYPSPNHPARVPRGRKHADPRHRHRVREPQAQDAMTLLWQARRVGIVTVSFKPLHLRLHLDERHAWIETFLLRHKRRAHIAIKRTARIRWRSAHLGWSTIPRAVPARRNMRAEHDLIAQRSPLDHHLGVRCLTGARGGAGPLAHDLRTAKDARRVCLVAQDLDAPVRRRVRYLCRCHQVVRDQEVAESVVVEHLVPRHDILADGLVDALRAPHRLKEGVPALHVDCQLAHVPGEVVPDRNVKAAHVRHVEAHNLEAVGVVGLGRCKRHAHVTVHPRVLCHHRVHSQGTPCHVALDRRIAADKELPHHPDCRQVEQISGCQYRP
mmetsp:Transcript_5434/g.10942  ORF Transcript_5434/g.10942 Transcript_5434/m.10942 type:complete len:556 (+) Transcript_5434:1946-3613(+)